MKRSIENPRKELDLWTNEILKSLGYLNHEFILWSQERFTWHPTLLRVRRPEWDDVWSAFSYKYKWINWIVSTGHQHGNFDDAVFYRNSGDPIKDTITVPSGSSLDMSITLPKVWPEKLVALESSEWSAPIWSAYGFPVDTNMNTYYSFTGWNSGKNPVRSVGQIKRNIGKNPDRQDSFYTDFINQWNSGWPIISLDGKDLIWMLQSTPIDKYSWKFLWVANFYPAREINKVLDWFLEHLEKNGYPITQEGIYAYLSEYRKASREEKRANWELAQSISQIFLHNSSGAYQKIYTIVKNIVDNAQWDILDKVLQRPHYIVLAAIVAVGDKNMMNTVLEHYNSKSSNKIDWFMREVLDGFTYIVSKYWADTSFMCKKYFQSLSESKKYSKQDYLNGLSSMILKDKKAMDFLWGFMPKW